MKDPHPIWSNINRNHGVYVGESKVKISDGAYVTMADEIDELRERLGKLVSAAELLLSENRKVDIFANDEWRAARRGVEEAIKFAKTEIQ